MSKAATINDKSDRRLSVGGAEGSLPQGDAAVAMASPLKEIVLLMGLSGGELERVLEEALERLKNSNIQSLVGGLEEKFGRVVPGEEGRPTSEERVLKLVYERVYDSVALRGPELVSSVSYVAKASTPQPILVSGVRARSKTPTAQRDSQTALARRRSLDSDKSSEIIDSTPCFQSALSQTAYLQFYNETRASYLLKSADDQQAKSPLYGSKRAHNLITAIANEMVSKVVNKRSEDETDRIDIRDMDRATKTSVLVADQRNQFDADFEKYLNQQTQKIRELNISEVAYRPSARAPPPETTANAPGDRHSPDPLGSLPTFGASLRDFPPVPQTPLGSSFCDANEFSYTDLQRLSCLLYRKLRASNADPALFSQLLSQPQMENLLKKFDSQTDEQLNRCSFGP